MLQVGFDRIDITHEIEEAARAYVNDLLGLVMGDLKAHGGVVVFDTVLCFGGGAKLLNGIVESSRVNVVVMEEPEFANAIGFRIRAQIMLAIPAILGGAALLKADTITASLGMIV